MFTNDLPNMDNFKVKIVSMSMNHFDTIFALLFEMAGVPRSRTDNEKVVTHFSKSPSQLILICTYENDSKIFEKLPFTLELASAKAFSLAFLKSADYVNEPDIDGDCVAGFELTDGCSDVWSGDSIIIRPAWAMQGK